MSGHTPGPWVARKVGGVGFAGQAGYAIDFNADQEQVVDFVYEEADARLIAAAPELLSALELALDYVERHTFGGTDGLALIDIARAAIAKAKGEAL